MAVLSAAATGSVSLSSTSHAPTVISNFDNTADSHSNRDDNNLLNFSDLSPDLLQLSYQQAAENRTVIAAQPTALSAPSQCDPSDSAASTANPASLITSRPNPRKPSPGLAARLKALGFGGAPRKASSSLPADHVGRLPEEQLRKIDHDHLQASSLNTSIERRGIPWKGIARIPSRSSLKSTKANRSAGRSEADSVASEATDGDTKAELLPEIVATLPLEMDTNKYRLPDHTNGNGVKAQLETREEHLARDVRPPSPEGPLPPPKDTPPLSQEAVSEPATAASEPFNPYSSLHFNPLGLQRAGSIYTISRASFQNQLAQLTSIQLPDAESLSGKVSAIPTAQAAAKALINAAEQIRGWIYKATEVVLGLESEDDVEWAAAGGREGVEEVENAILRFEELIHVYVSAIEELQSRVDIAQVAAHDLTQAVAQMEAILDEWTKIRSTLRSVKAQVEIAMEWEELWNSVLGDIQNEMDELDRLVFEMEERRHKSAMAIANGDGVDIGDLQTIVEETPQTVTRLHSVSQRVSLPPFPASPSSPSLGPSTMSHDDSSLLALFARMQPLRASLDFLPIRLSIFEARAEKSFPTACEELEMRRTGLDASYKKLEKDAESLRKELGEDRWVLVFRGAARQAQKMYESVERSVVKLREAVDAGMHLTNLPIISKKIESYEAKKTHYGPAIERVLGIIDKGVKDRLTVNGEIVRLHNEMQDKWQELKERMGEMDLVLEDIQADNKSQQLRDSISSMLSIDRSTVGSGNETPGSSPPSSVILSSLGLSKPPSGVRRAKPRTASSGSHLPQPVNRRQSSMPSPSQIPRKPLSSRLSTFSSPSREGSVTPLSYGSPRPPSTLGNRPKWSASTNTNGLDTGHNFKPLSLTTPSPYAKQTPTPVRSVSSLGGSSVSRLAPRSPLSRAGSASPCLDVTPSKPAAPPRLSFRERLEAPGPYSQQVLSRPKLSTSNSTTALNSRRSSLQPPRPDGLSSLASARPASSLASGRRSSLMPPKARSVTGRESPQAVAGARMAMRQSSSSSTQGKPPQDSKPRWKG